MPQSQQESLKTSIEHALIDIAPFTRRLGGLEFYGTSTEFDEVFKLFEEFVASLDPASASSADDAGRKKIVFLERHHGKTTLAKALCNEIGEKISTLRLFDGTAGQSWNELRQLEDAELACVIIDDLPVGIHPRRKAVNLISSFAGHLILLTRPEYRAAEGLVAIHDKVVLSHVDDRIEDKACWLIGLLWEVLRAPGGNPPDDARALLRKIPADTFAVLCENPFGDRVACLEELAQNIVEALSIESTGDATLGADPNLLLRPFFAFYSGGGTQEQSAGFRVWVEGDTDVNILAVTAELGGALYGMDLKGGLDIRPLGSDREGGTLHIPEIVAQHNANKNRDLFLLDNDEAGRQAEKKLKVLNQSVKLLPKEFLRKQPSTDSSLEIEIEDLVSLDCLDRFYTGHPELTPEYEGLYYKDPPIRRLVVNGTDKDRLVEWLKENAKFEDMERVVYLLCELRHHFGLAGPKSSSEMSAWRNEICQLGHHSSSSGLRPHPWWYVSDPGGSGSNT